MVRDVSFRVGRGESFGLVGESGCGKSTIALGIVRYLARNGKVTGGKVEIDGRDVLAMNTGELRKLRQSTVSMVYQEPGRALNPTIKVGRQVAEVFELAGVAKAEALDRSREMLEKVRISNPGRRDEPLSPPAVGGNAPARSDRDGARGRAGAADPRRADNRARRDRRVRGARPDLGASNRVPHVVPVHQPQPRRDREDVRPRRACSTPASWSRRDRRARCSYSPRHPYTVGLLRCIPRRDTLKANRALDTIPGSLPSPGVVPDGCIFADRCGLVEDRCRTEAPPLYEIDQAPRAAAPGATSTSARRRCRA